MSTRVMAGSIDLTGQITPNGLLVVTMARRSPLMWQVRCTRCGSTWNEPHNSVTQRHCRFSECGRSPSEPRATLVQTGVRTEFVRSRDSQSAREFQRESASTPSVTWAAEPTVEAMSAADPASVRNYLDSLEGR